MNDKQAKLIQAVAAHWQLHGQGPTYEDLGSALGVTRAAVDWHTNRAIDAGLLTRVPGRHYDVRVAEKAAR